MPVKKSMEVEAKEVPAGKDTTIQVLISSQEGPNFALRKFSMKAGGGMPLHTNTVEHEQYVLGRASQDWDWRAGLRGPAGRRGFHPRRYPPFLREHRRRAVRVPVYYPQ